jgi:hypothetical protein
MQGVNGYVKYTSLLILFGVHRNVKHVHAINCVLLLNLRWLAKSDVRKETSIRQKNMQRLLLTCT